MAPPVKGLDKLIRQLSALPQAAKEEAAAVLADQSAALAQKIAAACAVPEIAATLIAEQNTGSGKATSGNAKAEAGLSYRVSASSTTGEKHHVYNPRWEEFGTHPHSLAPGAQSELKNRDGSIKRKGKLQDKGPWHPGARARPFFWPTVRAWKKPFKRLIAQGANRAAKKAAKS